MDEPKWGAGRLLRVSAQIFRAHFTLIVLICLAVYLPVYVIYQFIPVTNPFVMSGTELRVENVEQFLVQAYIIIAVFIVFTPLASAAVAHIVRQALDRKPVTLSGVLDASLIKWPKLALTSLFFLVVLSVTSCLPPLTLYLGVACGFYVNLIALSDAWGFQALWQSRLLVKGRWWRTGLVFLIVWLAYLVYNQLYIVVLSLFSLNGVWQVLIATASEIPMRFFTLFLALYFIVILQVKAHPPEKNETD